MRFDIKSEIFIACPDRMAPWLEQELLELGYAAIETNRTGVRVEGTLHDCVRLNLRLRCGTQVRYSLGAFRANHPDDIRNRVTRLEWEVVIPGGGYFSVTNSAEHFTLNNTMYLNLLVKDAVVDRFREKTGTRPDSGSSFDGVVIHVHWKDDRAEIFLDTSGHPLTRHGYRLHPGKAPMQEILAAAVVRATGWDRSSSFVNPMCGSGTLAIEAALLATHRFPGLLRERYAFMNLKDFDAEDFRKEKELLHSEITEQPDLVIVASDRDEQAISIARENARLAGVESIIRFACCDFRETEMPDTPGVIILNPEYGERLGDEVALQSVYAAIGDFFKQKCAGYSGFIFTGNMELAKKIRLQPSRRTEFFSAKLDCRLLRYELYSGTRRKSADNQPSA